MRLRRDLFKIFGNVNKWKMASILPVDGLPFDLELFNACDETWCPDAFHDETSYDHRKGMKQALQV